MNRSDTGDMNRVTTQFDLDRIGRTIDIDGLRAVPAPLLDAVIASARQLRLRPVATAVLADPRAPTVARERAFGLVAMTLGQRLGPTPQEVNAA